MNTSESRCIAYEPCEACGSKDNVAVYDDGHRFCFGCRNLTQADGDKRSTPVVVVNNSKFISGTVSAIPSRGLSLETCKRYNYQIGEMGGEKCHIAPFYDSNRVLVAQKVRKAGKKFTTLGEGRNKGFFGQHLFNGGKYLVISEGEIDALSISQAFSNKYPAVSLPDGVTSAERVVRENYEWLDGFETIVLMFDMDDKGQPMAEKVAQMTKTETITRRTGTPAARAAP